MISLGSLVVIRFKQGQTMVLRAGWGRVLVRWGAASSAAPSGRAGAALPGEEWIDLILKGWRQGWIGLYCNPWLKSWYRNLSLGLWCMAAVRPHGALETGDCPVDSVHPPRARSLLLVHELVSFSSAFTAHHWLVTGWHGGPASQVGRWVLLTGY